MKTRYTEIIGTDAQIAKLTEYQVDNLVERAERALDMWPDNLHINIVLMDTAEDIQAYYLSYYGKKVDYISFISLDRMTIYFSVEDLTEDVIAHELGHATIETFFTERPPYRIHELMAQYCAKNIGVTK